MEGSGDPGATPRHDGHPDVGDARASRDLESLRTELETLGEIPVADRVERFEQVNAVLAAELAELDEV